MANPSPAQPGRSGGAAGHAAGGSAAASANANELGRVMVLEYHNIKSGKGPYFQTPAQLRSDLQQLYDNGYATIDIHDFLSGHITTPAGKTPVVLTFDDASPNQFRYLEDGGKPRVDPDCAVAILEAFDQSHPDFGHAATFFVLPDGFGQPKYKAEKYRYLVSHGFTIGNHTWTHPIMTHLSPAKVQEELGRDDADIHAILPNYTLDILAYPFGTRPKTNNKPDYTYIRSGAWKGDHYHIAAAFLVGAEPTASPYSVKFRPYAIPRVQAIPAGPDRWTRFLKAGRFISDGDPDTVTVPGSLKAEVNPTALQGKKLAVR
ncbi:MAG: polysaccharide deacetylase family protein [Chloroflexi bacterium]|nr:polysaccharide deacetylase family protein [Chloroflexota bacterium]